MNRTAIFRLGVIVVLSVLGSYSGVYALNDEGVIERIGFGSCLFQNRWHPVLVRATEREPDMFIFLGDNVYVDSRNEFDFVRAYDQLAGSALFRRLRDTTMVRAIWDDHDYGWNDAGREYELKEVAERVFLDFWDVPADDDRRRRPGIYSAEIHGPPGRRVQIILLDTRFFRSPLARGNPEAGLAGRGPYRIQDDPETTILGAEQWEWLERELRRPAEVRIIASSIQVVAEHHGWESWANAPLERERLFELVGRSTAFGTSHVVFISGDRHFSELSRDPSTGFLDVTSSGINRSYPTDTPITPNAHRVLGPIRPHNVGEIEILWDDDSTVVPPRVVARIHTLEQRSLVSLTVDPVSR